LHELVKTRNLVGKLPQTDLRDALRYAHRVVHKGEHWAW